MLKGEGEGEGEGEGAMNWIELTTMLPQVDEDLGLLKGPGPSDDDDDDEKLRPPVC